MRISNGLLLFSTFLSSTASADEPTFSAQDVEQYDNGTYGLQPTETFHTSNITAYRLLNDVHNDERCDSSSHLFLAPRGQRLPTAGPMILDTDGHLVWFAQGFPRTYNFRVQWYKGEQYLTWWHGLDFGGHGKGDYYMYDKNYQHFKTISPNGHYSADIHEFLITSSNTAIITIYDQVSRNLSEHGGPANGAIWDCLFQEIDLETNELLFEWRATDHFTFSDVYEPYRDRSSPISHTLNGNRPALSWDWFHLNSVDKDDKGNYLVSARYTHAIYYISGITGSIIWQLAGRNNSFTDLSAGRATVMNGQHHATWQDSYSAITVYDNNGNNWDHRFPSRALKIILDQNAMTASLAAEAVHPQGYITQSQGSVQQLPNGNLFVGYGIRGAMAEYSPDGRELLCDWQIGALHPGGVRIDLGSAAGTLQNYRAFKEHWKGFPLEAPKVKVDGEGAKLWVSWNGATEVKRWMLEGAQKEEGTKQLIWQPAGETFKQGFETGIDLPHEIDVYRLTALNASADPLGLWIIRPDGAVTPISYPPAPSHTTTNHILATVFAILTFFTTSTIFLRRRKARISATPLPPLMLRFSQMRGLVPRWARFLGVARAEGRERRYADGGEEGAEQEMGLLERGDRGAEAGVS